MEITIGSHLLVILFNKTDRNKKIKKITFLQVAQIAAIILHFPFLRVHLIKIN
jgi:hypothetical protein